jgi:hypothetical protein
MPARKMGTTLTIPVSMPLAMDPPQNSGFFNMARDFTVTNGHFTEVSGFKQHYAVHVDYPDL